MDDPWLSFSTAPTEGNAFAFDLTEPSHWTPMPPPPKEYR